MSSIAIIGAGTTGLSAARQLVRHGHRVRLFDKGRRVGGRIASRETPFGSFDHGAVFVPEAEAATREILLPLVEAAQASPWPVRSGDDDGASGWVGVPTMNRLAQAWAAGLDIRCGVPVIAVRAAGPRWRLRLEGESLNDDVFDAVLVTVPVPQALALLPETIDTEVLRSISYDPCWTVMWTPQAALPDEPALQRGAADAMIASIVREDLKPQRGGPPRLTVQASAAWSRAHLECAADDVATRLIEAAARERAVPVSSAFRLAHRWRYAFARQTLGCGSVPLAPGLRYASDACLGSRIDRAWAAGQHAAQQVLEDLAD